VIRQIKNGSSVESIIYQLPLPTKDRSVESTGPPPHILRRDDDIGSSIVSDGYDWHNPE
jgi:hypothetical protein